MALGLLGVVSGTSLGLYITSCFPSLSCLVCKTGVMIPSLPALKGLHKDARGQCPGMCLGH